MRQVRAERLGNKRIVKPGWQHGRCRRQRGKNQRVRHINLPTGQTGFGRRLIQHHRIGQPVIRISATRRDQRRRRIGKQSAPRRAISGGGGDGADAIANTLHRSDSPRHQKIPRFSIEVFGDRAAHRGRQASRRSGSQEADRIIAVERLTLIKTSGRIILNDHGGVIAIGEQRGENRPVRSGTPQIGVVVKRIGHGRGQRQLCTQAVGGGGTRTRQLKPPRLGGIGKHCRTSPRTGKPSQTAASRHAGNGEKFQRLQHLCRFIHPDHAKPVKQRVIHLVCPGQRAGVADRQFAAKRRATGFQNDKRHIVRQRLQRCCLKPLAISDALNMDADGADLGKVGKRVDEILDVQHRLIANREHIAERQATLRHRQIGGQHAALGDDSGTAPVKPATMGEWPERHAVDIIDQAIAVRADYRHVASRLDQRRFHRRAIAANLGKAGGVDNGTACPHRTQPGKAVDRLVTGYGNEHGIRRFGQIINRFETGKTTDRLALRVDWPEWTVIADTPALASHGLGINAAQNGDMARAQKPTKIGLQGRAVRRRCHQSITRQADAGLTG